MYTSPVMENCTFARNKALGPSAEAGAVLATGGSQPAFHSCTFKHNSDDQRYASGLFASDVPDVLLNNTEFIPFSAQSPVEVHTTFAWVRVVSSTIPSRHPALLAYDSSPIKLCLTVSTWVPK